jgi:hypothetical protein
MNTELIEKNKNFTDQEFSFPMPSEEQLKEMGLNIRQMKQITGC